MASNAPLPPPPPPPNQIFLSSERSNLPAPPPPPMPTSLKTSAAPVDGRSQLLADIRKGAALKKAYNVSQLLKKLFAFIIFYDIKSKLTHI